jgi:hypothetical protein
MWPPRRIVNRVQKNQATASASMVRRWRAVSAVIGFQHRQPWVVHRVLRPRLDRHRASDRAPDHTDRFGAQLSPLVYGWIRAGHQFGAATAAYGAGPIRVRTNNYVAAFLAAGIAYIVAAIFVMLIRRRADALRPLPAWTLWLRRAETARRRTPSFPSAFP